MANKSPVVMNDESNAHERIKDGDTLSPVSIPVSVKSGNTLTREDDGLFVAGGGGGGGGLEKVTAGDGLTGEGTETSPLSAKVSAATDNILSVLGGISETPGLYVKSVRNSLFSDTPVIVKDDPYIPNAARLTLRLSTRSGNSLSVIEPDGTIPTAETGLFVPPGATMKRGTGGGNFSFGYPDNKTAKTACGKLGAGVYWKVTVTLSDAGAGNVATMPRVWTNDIPCMEDGTLTPYQFVVDYVESRNNAIPSAAVWMICMGVPTHTINITTGVMTKLQRADSGVTGGLDDLYPVAPSGEYAQEPMWRREYFYTA